MPLMDWYAPGTFCWADLGTSDAAAAKRFYTALFGWTAEDRSMGPDAAYTMLTLSGRAVAALYPQEPAPVSGSPSWLSYISVASANDSAGRARDLGGSVLIEPFDVLDVGRMCLVQDPAGAVVALWQPQRHAGAGVIGETNAMCWNELATTDPAGAEPFYTSLLGWDAGTSAGPRYTTFSRQGAPRAGELAIEPSWGAVPPRVSGCLAVGGSRGQAALVQSLGGAVRVPPRDIPGVGRFAVVADPQGAIFAILQIADPWRQRGG
jgi:predicted enzyme related to lactoylglutathione lyase